LDRLDLRKQDTDVHSYELALQPNGPAWFPPLQPHQSKAAPWQSQDRCTETEHLALTSASLRGGEARPHKSLVKLLDRLANNRPTFPPSSFISQTLKKIFLNK